MTPSAPSRLARARLPLALGLSLLALGMIADPGQTAPAKAATIRIANFDFGPGVVTVAPGATVTWINADEDAHTIVSDSKVFHSKPMDTGDQFSFTFQAPGDYAYHCGLHPHMVGKIVVRP